MISSETKGKRLKHNRAQARANTLRIRKRHQIAHRTRIFARYPEIIVLVAFVMFTACLCFFYVASKKKDDFAENKLFFLSRSKLTQSHTAMQKQHGKMCLRYRLCFICFCLCCSFCKVHRNPILFTFVLRGLHGIRFHRCADKINTWIRNHVHKFATCQLQQSRGQKSGLTAEYGQLQQDLKGCFAMLKQGNSFIAAPSKNRNSDAPATAIWIAISYLASDILMLNFRII